MQSWALERFGDELVESLKEHMGRRGLGSEQRPANDDDMSLALCWLLIDRELGDSRRGCSKGRYQSTLGSRSNQPS
jgi:hypothetical protein